MLQLHTGLILWTIIIFLLLVFLLRKLAWKPILSALDERTRNIRESLAQADTAKKDVERMRAEYESMLAAARQESQDVLAKSRKTAESLREEMVQKAQQEVEALRQRATRDIALEREKAVEEIKRTAGELSVAIAAKIIGKSLNAKDHQDLIKQALRDIRPLVNEPN
ncbi:MAG: F0F1 ATP synthase subunit B [bacterium]